MNDWSEVIHGAEIFAEVCADANLPIGQDIKNYYGDFFSGGRRFKNYYRSRVYICSFTELGDDLSHWRGYSVGGGASIGFGSQGLMSALERSDSELYPCIYEDSKKYEIASSYLHLVDKLLKSIDKPSRQHALTVAMDHILFFMSIFKSDAYKAEREWRAIGRLQSPCGYR